MALTVWPGHMSKRLWEKNPEDVGTFIGICFVFANQALVISMIVKDCANHPFTHWKDRQALNAVAVLSFLLGISFFAYISLLVTFLSDVVQPPDTIQDAHQRLRVPEEENEGTEADDAAA